MCMSCAILVKQCVMVMTFLLEDKWINYESHSWRVFSPTGAWEVGSGAFGDDQATLVSVHNATAWDRHVQPRRELGQPYSDWLMLNQIYADYALTVCLCMSRL